MENAQTILVVILSTFLAIFLVVGIIVLSKLIQVLDSLKRITEKAEHLADTAENIGEFFKNTAGPAALIKLISNIVINAFKSNKKSKE